MQQQVFYIHGGSAFSSYENYLEHLRTTPVEAHPGERPKRWADSLEEDLGEDYEVFKPAMPGKYNAKYEEWKIWFERHFEFLHDNVILIGWSQGGMFLLKYLSENQLPFSVKALYFLATPYDQVEYQGDDGGDFYANIEKIGTVASAVPKITIMHSKDDFVVPYEHAGRLQAALPGSDLITFTDRNHFLTEEFPELVAHIKGL